MIKYTLYIGLNDRDTEVSLDINKSISIINEYFKDYKYTYIVKIVIFFTKKSGLFHRKYKKVINSVRKCYKLCRIVLKKIQSDKDIVYIEKIRIYAVFGTLHNLLKIFLKNSN